MAKRRKQGSGTVRKRSDGRWEARVVVDYDEKGLPKTKTAVAKTRRECMDKLKALQEEYGPPVTKCKPDMSVGQWMDFWYQNYEKMKLRLMCGRKVCENMKLEKTSMKSFLHSLNLLILCSRVSNYMNLLAMSGLKNIEKIIFSSRS